MSAINLDIVETQQELAYFCVFCLCGMRENRLVTGDQIWICPSKFDGFCGCRETSITCSIDKSRALRLTDIVLVKVGSETSVKEAVELGENADVPFRLEFIDNQKEYFVWQFMY